ncbi:MAG: hypothetical protein COC01_09835 [Bacteroidetes bacterium]|nr:MAG: hypothetical protein COC01_09835 [Bacteroidota bacterium]
MFDFYATIKSSCVIKLVVLITILSLYLSKTSYSQCIVFCDLKRSLAKYKPKHANASNFGHAFTKKTSKYKKAKKLTRAYASAYLMPSLIQKNTQDRKYRALSKGIEIGYSITKRFYMQIGLSEFRSNRVSEPLDYTLIKDIVPDSLDVKYRNSTGNDLDFVSYQNNFVDLRVDLKMLLLDPYSNFNIYLLTGLKNSFVNNKQILPQLDRFKNSKTYYSHTSYLSGAIGFNFNFLPTLAFNTEIVYRYSLNELVNSHSTISYTYLVGVKSGIFYQF